MFRVDPNDEKRALFWLLAAGVFAICLSCFLYLSDLALSNWDREANLKRTLHELRLAQTTLDSNVSDERQLLHITGRAEP